MTAERPSDSLNGEQDRTPIPRKENLPDKVNQIPTEIGIEVEAIEKEVAS